MNWIYKKADLLCKCFSIYSTERTNIWNLQKHHFQIILDIFWAPLSISFDLFSKNNLWKIFKTPFLRSQACEACPLAWDKMRLLLPCVSCFHYKASESLTKTKIVFWKLICQEIFRFYLPGQTITFCHKNLTVKFNVKYLFTSIKNGNKAFLIDLNLSEKFFKNRREVRLTM